EIFLTNAQHVRQHSTA
ncbi:hypothetical protein ECEC1848_3299, partial [Escherichia coli EC1848]